MTDFIYWPQCMLNPRETVATPVAFTRGGGRSLGGVERTIRTDRGFWRIELQGIVVRTRDQKRVWNAIRTKLSGRSGLLAIPVKSFDTAPYLSGAYEQPQSVTHSDDTTFSDGTSYKQGAIVLTTVSRAAVGATQITIEFVNAALSPSGIRFSYQNAMYETGPVIGQSNNIYSVSVFPAIRKAIPAGSSLKSEPPWCMVHLAEDDGMALAEGKRLASEANVAFVEATDFWSDGGS